MDITTNLEGLTKIVGKATFSQDEVAKGFEQIYRENIEKVKIPGFRPGKAPYRIFVSRVGQDFLRDEYSELAARQAFSKIIEGQHLKIVGRPELKIISFENAGPLKLEISINLIPDFALPEPDKIEVKLPSFEVTSDLIDKSIDNIRNRYAVMKPINRPAANNDFVYFSWSVVNDGEPAQRSKEELVELGREDFVKDFDKNLVGVINGEKKRIKTIIKEGEEPVEIEIRIGEIKERCLPPLDEDFLKTVSFESLDAFKQAVKTELEIQAMENRERYIESELVKQLLEKTQFDVPLSLIDAAISDEIDSLSRNLARKNLTLEIYLKKSNKTLEQLRDELSPKATNQAKLDVILDEFASKFEITALEKEVTQELEEISKVMKEAKRPIPDQTDEIMRGNIANLIVRRKTVATLTGKVRLT